MEKIPEPYRAKEKSERNLTHLVHVNLSGGGDEAWVSLSRFPKIPSVLQKRKMRVISNIRRSNERGELGGVMGIFYVPLSNIFL